MDITNLNENINASKFGFAPEIFILTDEGDKKICEFEGEDINIWNGKEWSNVQIIKTGIKQHVITVIIKPHFNNPNDIRNTNCYRYVRCTPNYKFYIYKDNNNTGKVIQVEAQNLKPNMKLVGYYLPEELPKELLGELVENFKFNLECMDKYFFNRYCLNSHAHTGYDYSTIFNVSDTGDICDTYFFTQPKNHNGIFNGILIC